MRNAKQKSDVLKKGRSLIYVLAACLLMAATVIGCDRFNEQKTRKEIKKITLGVSATSLLPSLVYIAKDMGYLLEEGVDLEIKGYPTGKHAFLAMLDGEIDMATVADTPIVFNSFKRTDFSIFGTIVDSAQHAKGIGRRDRGINAPEDLVGKKVATTRGTTAHFFLEEFLLSNFIRSSEIELVNLKPKEMVKSIENGEVDAIFSWEPNVSNALKALGNNATPLPAEVGYMATFNLVSKNDLIKDNPEQIRGVLKGLARAEDFMKENREVSVDIVASYLKTARKTIDGLWDIYSFRLSLSQTLVITLEGEARWAIRNKLTDKTEVPNYLAYIYMDALEEVKPEAVSIIR